MRWDVLNGQRVARFDDDKSLEDSIEDAESSIESGDTICLTDLMIKAERGVKA